MPDKWWAKVLFKEFIKHFRKMDDEQIVRDIRQSMDDLEELVPDTDTFGSKMVRWSIGRADEPPAVASRENGKKGGRPRKNPAKLQRPQSKTEFMDWVRLNGIDEVDAIRCYEMEEANGWTDKNGKPVTDWKAYIAGFVKDQASKRKEK